MPVAFARPIVLTNAERERSKKAAYGHKTAYQARQRAAIVRHAARGRPNAHIVRESVLHLDTVRTWRNRFADGRLPALADRRPRGALRVSAFHPSAGRRGQGPGASSRPRPGVPLSLVVPGAGHRADRAPGHRQHLRVHGTPLVAPGRAQVRQYRSWIFIRDPDFRAKAQRVLDLYARTFEGEPLGTDEYVVSSDEKTSIQAAAVALRLWPRTRPGRRASKTPTGAAAPWPTWPPTTSTGPSARPLRTAHRHRPVHDPGRPGHDTGTLRQRQTCLLGRRQRLFPPRQEGRRTADGGVPECRR
ncbi:helix-turn-helix domain-containing protein [Streptomyces sp. NPDC058637]|uniref:helix-turn-helix domain-containing protein n=1 Tax=Streptomyces sp. NPDC058637 TaxID=3346569 RepID=UPI00366702C4